MSGFWEAKKDIKKPTAHEMANAMNQKELYGEPVEDKVVLDEQALAEVQGQDFNVFDDEDEDISAIMMDANLRLEQGRLYQMVLQSNIFADTDADPRAIRNVHREIRKLAKDRLEILLGIKQEQQVQETIVSSPFNDLEVTVLKMLASKMSKGATEETPNASGPEAPPAVPKKDGITAISGSIRPQTTPAKPLPKFAPPMPQKSQPKPASKAAPKAAKPVEEESTLTKPIDQMTPEELAAHDKAASERALKKHAATPSGLVPHPTPAQLEMMYATSAAQMTIANPWRVNQPQ